MKNLLKVALLAGLFSGAAYADNEQGASEAVTRFEGVKKVFTDKGIDAIPFLNGVGSLGSETGKGRENENIGDSAGIEGFNDPQAPLICIGNDDTYIVHTAQPSLVGQSAVTGASIWRDGTGVEMVKGDLGARAALSRSPNGLTSIKYVQNSTMVNPREGQSLAENFSLAVADSRYIKGLPEGAFCATRIQYFEARDESDADRSTKPDAGEYPREKTGVDGADVPHHGHKHHKHHEAKDAKKDAKDAKDAAKDAKDAAKDAKDAAKDTKDAAKDAKDASKDAKDASKDAKDAAKDAKDAAKPEEKK